MEDERMTMKDNEMALYAGAEFKGYVPDDNGSPHEAGGIGQRSIMEGAA
jgi:hypothetical protein